ncbi:hypothetical protein GON03_07310 [Nocardioides sp. MAH-18]|uniref:Uncharacterized protein n=1 Tax=Nocardioides agri TaxID=2682843 RepID=A0A6L6XQX7_9ACTN|nr:MULTISPECIES: hypothetical protein [unclassified Nocardioides]MBA2954124.1 hypothetical protein [Nocardioides sp. CGMCC 1.13656]MVQ48986.1 hypothetical protein [Nocardioides sp. MAH-18]
MTAPRELRVQVGTLRVVGGSTIEARRIADALPVALERALAGRRATAPGPADLVADAVASRVRRESSDAWAEVGP